MLTQRASLKRASNANSYWVLKVKFYFRFSNQNAFPLTVQNAPHAIFFIIHMHYFLPNRDWLIHLQITSANITSIHPCESEQLVRQLVSLAHTHCLGAWDKSQQGETLHDFWSGCAVTLALSGPDLSEIINHVGWSWLPTAPHYIQLAKVLNPSGTSAKHGHQSGSWPLSNVWHDISISEVLEKGGKGGGRIWGNGLEYKNVRGFIITDNEWIYLLHSLF